MFRNRKRQGPWQRDIPEGVNTESPLSKGEGLEIDVAPTERVNPLELRPLEEGSAAQPANLGAVQLSSKDDTVSKDKNYHVDYCRDQSTF